jgi:hypothetical protein
VYWEQRPDVCAVVFWGYATPKFVLSPCPLMFTDLYPKFLKFWTSNFPNIVYFLIRSLQEKMHLYDSAYFLSLKNEDILADS